MAVYNIDVTNPIADYKAALQTSGKLGSILYEDTGYLIFTAPTICDYHIKIYATSSSLSFYVGDSYTSGTSLNNQKTISRGYDSGTTQAIVITDSIIAVTSYQNYTQFGIVGKLANGVDNFAFGMIGQSSYPQYGNALVNYDYCLCASDIITPSLTADNKYYAVDVYFKNGANIVMPKATPSPAAGIKILAKPYQTSPHYNIANDDIALTGGYYMSLGESSSNKMHYDFQILVQGGNL